MRKTVCFSNTCITFPLVSVYISLNYIEATGPISEENIKFLRFISCFHNPVFPPTCGGQIYNLPKTKPRALSIQVKIPKKHILMCYHKKGHLPLRIGFIHTLKPYNLKEYISLSANGSTQKGDTNRFHRDVINFATGADGL